MTAVIRALASALEQGRPCPRQARHEVAACLGILAMVARMPRRGTLAMAAKMLLRMRRLRKPSRVQILAAQHLVVVVAEIVETVVVLALPPALEQGEPLPLGEVALSVELLQVEVALSVELALMVAHPLEVALSVEPALSVDHLYYKSCLERVLPLVVPLVF